MLDKHLVPLTKSPLKRMALILQQSGVSANQITVTGFIIGVVAMVLVAKGYFIAGMLATALLMVLTVSWHGSLAQPMLVRFWTSAWTFCFMPFFQWLLLYMIHRRTGLPQPFL